MRFATDLRGLYFVAAAIVFVAALSARVDSQANAQRPAAPTTNPEPRNQNPAQTASYVGSVALRRLPRGDLRALVEDAHGERRPRSEGASGGHHPGSARSRIRC